MPTQEDFPPKWTCESPEKKVKVEIRNPGGQKVTAETEAEISFGRVFEGIDIGGPTRALISIKTDHILSDLGFEVVDEDGNLEKLYTLDSPEVFYENGRYNVALDRSELPENPSVNVITATAYSWIEIPTSDVEFWQEKGDAASIQRTAKVKFPTEWGETPPGGEHNSPRQLLESFEATDAKPFMFGRVWAKDDEGGWVMQHLGWIGGIGAASGNNQSKLWLYDFAEFLTGVPAGETFNDPTIETASEKIANIIVEKTGIPLSGIAIIAPDTEEEVRKLSGSPTDSGGIRGASVAVGNETVYYSLAGTGQEIFALNGELYSADSGAPIQQDQIQFDAVTIGTGAEFGPINVGSKHFASNHDTLLDVIDWFEKKTQAKIHFEPTPNGQGVTMVVDVVPSRRTFVGRGVIEGSKAAGNPIEYHEPIHVTKNTALYEMKPTNTIHLRGSYPKGILDEATDALSGALEVLPGHDGPPPEKYPVVKAQVPPLVEAANGVEVAGKVVESDATYLPSAEREAKRRLSNVLGETSEGEIVMYGEPRLAPYDKIVAYEVCDNQIQYEQDPVEYEVQSVKHNISASEPFLTRVTVSIYVNDKHIEIVESKMVEVDQ